MYACIMNVSMSACVIKRDVVHHLVVSCSVPPLKVLHKLYVFTIEPNTQQLAT